MDKPATIHPVKELAWMPRSAIKDDVIQIRTSREAKALIMRTAELKQQRLPEFVRDSARQSAEETILDATLSRLSEEAHAAFIALLDNPPEPSSDVVARYCRKPVWEA
jgi:uncharacterized protein (DUF1778 family)